MKPQQSCIGSILYVCISHIHCIGKNQNVLRIYFQKLHIQYTIYTYKFMYVDLAWFGFPTDITQMNGLPTGALHFLSSIPTKEAASPEKGVISTTVHQHFDPWGGYQYYHPRVMYITVPDSSVDSFSTNSRMLKITKARWRIFLMVCLGGLVLQNPQLWQRKEKMRLKKGIKARRGPERVKHGQLLRWKKRNRNI